MPLNGVFDLGVVKIKGEIVYLTEINVSASREISERKTCDSHDPKEIRRGSKQVTFTAKRDIDDFKLSNLYEIGESFPMMIYNNDVEPPQAVMKLEGCVISKDEFGPINGDKPVGQNIEGRATVRKLL